MTHDLNAMDDATDEPKRSTTEAGPAIKKPDTEYSLAAAGFIGYEAADPSLYTPFWNEVLQAHAAKRNLR